MKYSFVDCNFEIEFDKGNERYSDFKTDGSDCVGKISVCDFDAVGAEVFGVEYISKPYARVMRSKNSPASMLLSNDDWSDCVICRSKNGEYSEELMIAAVYSSLCRLKALFMHASVIDYNENGLMFVGPSGVGKTTQAELWQEHEKAEILNGDKAFVRDCGNGFFVYGSPWKGSSPYSVNKKVPLKGIVVLRQSKENSIRKIGGAEMFELFVPHVFLPHWDEKCMENALATLDELVGSVPIYLLECRADKDAVELTKGFVFNG